MPTHIRFTNDNVDDESITSDSDEEYTEHEKKLLKNAQNMDKDSSDEEMEVFGVGANSESEDDIAASDIEDEKDDLPDVRAWGKDKRKYYATDYVDPDYQGQQLDDVPSAQIEEDEARTLQKILIEQLDDDDFTFEFFDKKSKENENQLAEEIIKMDISNLSRNQKLQVLEKESPELFALIEDFKRKMSIVNEYLTPVKLWIKDSKIEECRVTDFVFNYRRVILSYCTNICAYLLLKASNVHIQSHPVMKRLYQYRQILAQLDGVFEDIVKPQIEILRDKIEAKETTEKRTLRILEKLKKAGTVSSEKLVEPAKQKEVKFAINSESDEEEQEVAQEEETEATKRGITYEIKKNKGLTPYRKKELRNPRVKHRIKYRKAKIRRRGAVREVRKELSRYGGEISLN